MDYSKILSKTVQEIKPSGIRKFFDIANTMEGVISLGVGEPDFRTPWQIRSAGIQSLERGATKYTSNRGLEALREEISRYVERKYNAKYAPESEILVTVGGSEAIDLALRAIINPGDEVIVPGYTYRSRVSIFIRDPGDSRSSINDSHSPSKSRVKSLPGDNSLNVKDHAKRITISSRRS